MPFPVALRCALERYAMSLSCACRRVRPRVLVPAILLLAVMLGWAWSALHSVEYRAVVRVRLPVVADQRQKQLSNPAEELVSRVLLEKVAARLDRGGGASLEVSALQALLRVEVLPASGIIALQATGSDPAYLAAVLDSVLDVYREEGQAVTRLRAVAGALEAAGAELGEAEARLQEIQVALASGTRDGLGADDARLTLIADRVAELRGEIRDMERTFAPPLIRRNPQLRKLNGRIAVLERQIKTQRKAIQRNAVKAAQREVRQGRAELERLKTELMSWRAELLTVVDELVVSAVSAPPERGQTAWGGLAMAGGLTAVALGSCRIARRRRDPVLLPG
ncbi:hypothetical protein [Zoogloea sp. LCSB751]|uniref:hypothetical protein n=1 Tax=Zoogloea sp. LCSB751 TaxID=1965277 RepID=UPI001117A917|nr:hypothetical protein [Zoogloea sp. LCSB751]